MISRERLAETEGETVRLQAEYDDAVAQTKSAPVCPQPAPGREIQTQAELQAIQQKLQKLSTQRPVYKPAWRNCLPQRRPAAETGKPCAGPASSEAEAEQAARAVKEVTAARQKAESALQKAETELHVCATSKPIWNPA